MLEPVAFESFLERRFSRSTARKQPLIFELTDDIALKHQYYVLREDLPINLLGTRRLDIVQDEFDSHSHVIIARQGRQCIAGVRLTVKEPGADEKLPLEASGIKLSDLHLRYLASLRSAEVSGFIGIPDDNDGIVASGIAAEIYNALLFKKIRFAFFSVGQPLLKEIKLLTYNNNFAWHILSNPANGQYLYMADLAAAYIIKDDIKQYIRQETLPA